MLRDVDLNGLARTEEATEVVQPKGRDTLLGEKVTGGPTSGTDIRLYLHRKQLDVLAHVAKQSVVKRAVIRDVRLNVKRWQLPNGQRYMTWHVESDNLVMNERQGIIKATTVSAALTRDPRPNSDNAKLLDRLRIGQGDIRLIMALPQIEELSSRAAASITGRAVIWNCGLRVRSWLSSKGEEYQTWTFISDRPPESETPAIVLARP